MRQIDLFALIGVVGLLAGCSAPPSVHYGAALMNASEYTYGIVPFADNNAPQHRQQNPNAATTVQRAFESAFLRTGWKLVAVSEVQQQPARVDISGGVIQHVAAHVEDEDAIRAAKTAGATAVILGQVDVYFQGTDVCCGPDQKTTVGMSVRALDVNSKQILWIANHSRPVKFDFSSAPENFATKVADELVTSLLHPASAK